MRVLLLLLLTLPGLVQAQFNYTTNNDTITITGYTGPGGAVVIPDTINGLPVTKIGNFTFFRDTRLTSVTIGSGVTSIGSNAFFGCTGLTSFTIPNNVHVVLRGAFAQCFSLTNITIGSGVTNIGNDAFFGCISLVGVVIPGSVTSIGDYAFAYCDSMGKIYFQGDAPISGASVLIGPPSTVYYLPGTTGWGSRFGGSPTALWLPQVQAGDASFGVRTNQFGFNISWASGRVVVVEACTDLAHPIWSPVGTNMLIDGSSYFSDPQWTNHSARFYRLRSP